MRLASALGSIPFVWNFGQKLLGAPAFKRDLYRSVLHPPGPLLDFGCATGHIADQFSEFDYYGIDLDSAAIESAKLRFRDVPNMHFLSADIHARPFPENKFREVLFAGTAHHLSDELFLSILRELHYCLAPGGVLHLFDPTKQIDQNWQARFLWRIEQGKFGRTVEQILGMVKSLDLFEVGPHTLHRPYGALIRTSDFVYVPLTKRA